MRKIRLMRYMASVVTAILVLWGGGNIPDGLAQNDEQSADSTAAEAPKDKDAGTEADTEAGENADATNGEDADEDAGAVTQTGDDDYGEKRQGRDEDLQYRWKTAGRHYVVPLAFFSIHGYLEGVFASASPDWTAADPTQLGAPGHLLVPNTTENSFQYDAAIFISTDTSTHTRSLIELHLVSDPSGQGAAGPGGLTIAITEASISWDIYKSYFTLGGGLYWAPFGIVNIDWLGGQALFPLVPRASGAFPAHYNERGVRINGAASLGRGVGVNYVLSLGNGLQTYDLGGQASFDNNGDKTFISRVGVFPGLGPSLELGASFATGYLRDAVDVDLGLDDPLRYESRFTAVGGDLVWSLDALKLRGYYIYSQEALEEGASARPDLTRQGAMFETHYDVFVDVPLGNVRAIAPKARFDWLSTDVLSGGGTTTENFQTAVYSLGVDIKSAGVVGAVLSLEYHIQNEIKGPSLDNDRFIARLLAKF